MMTAHQAPRTTIAAARLQAFGATAFTRAAVLVNLHGQMERPMWLRLVGEFWTTTEGDKRELVRLMRTYDDWAPMMLRHESRVWSALPEWFQSWRGCYQGFNEDGPSYTTDRDEARDCPFLARYRMAGMVPLLRSVWVNRADCIVKMDRGKAEILARVVNEWDRMQLDRSVSLTAFAGTPNLPMSAWP